MSDSTVMDQSRDLTGSETHRILTIYAPPPYVKQASHDQRCGSAELPPHCYADQRRKLYPCHSAAATWLSSAFFMEKHAELSRADQEIIVRRLIDAARYFGIAADVGRLAVKAAEIASDDEAKLPDSEFAYIWEAGGKKERRLPLRNPHEVKAAADWLGKYRDRFTWEDRQRIASKILARAESWSVTLDNQEVLEKTAGFGCCPVEAVANMLEKRAMLCRKSQPDIATEVKRLATIVRNHPPGVLNNAIWHKVADIVDRFDRMTGLTKHYGQGLDMPEDTLFQITEKVARDVTEQNIMLTNGAV